MPSSGRASQPIDPPTIAIDWFTDREERGFPVWQRAFGPYGLTVRRKGKAWHWVVVRRDGDWRLSYSRVRTRDHEAMGVAEARLGSCDPTTDYGLA